MNEPLEGKKLYTNILSIDPDEERGMILEVFDKVKIKSAVEYLKSRLNYLNMSNGVLFDEIDKAFPDVTLPENSKHKEVEDGN